MNECQPLGACNDPNCGNCINDRLNSCTFCKSGFMPTSHRTCIPIVETIGYTFYLDQLGINKYWLKCKPGCKYCKYWNTVGSDLNCIECHDVDSHLVVVSTSPQTRGYCVLKCPEGTVSISKICRPCHTSCAACSLENDPLACAACKSGQLL